MPFYERSFREFLATVARDEEEDRAMSKKLKGVKVKAEKKNSHKGKGGMMKQMDIRDFMSAPM